MIGRIRNRRGWFSCAALVLSILMVPRGEAVGRGSCDLMLVHPGQIDVFAGESYDVFGDGLQAIPVEFVVRGSRPECPFAIGIASSGAVNGRRAARAAGQRVAYRLSPDRRGTVQLQDLPQARPAELLRGTIPPRGREFRDVYFVILDKGQGVPAGTYLDDLRLSLFDGLGGARVETVISRLRFRVDGVIDARFRIDGSVRALGGYAHVVDLGVLREGARRTFSLDIQSNQSFRVELASEGGGALQRVGGVSASVPYTLRVDGRPANLARPARLTRRPGPGGRSRAIPLTVEIGSLDRALAGTYKDTLRVTVTAD